MKEVVCTGQHGKWTMEPMHAPSKPQKATRGTSRISVIRACTSSIIMELAIHQSSHPTAIGLQFCFEIQLRWKVHLILCTYVYHQIRTSAMNCWWVSQIQHMYVHTTKSTHVRDKCVSSHTTSCQPTIPVRQNHLHYRNLYHWESHILQLLQHIQLIRSTCTDIIG